MARTSRKERLGLAGESGTAKIGTPDSEDERVRVTENIGPRVQKAYFVGIYARLSVDSHKEKNESIDNQIAIAKAYMERQTDMVLFDCYSDLGRTGTDFEREGFQRLMSDVRSRKVNCIIVKDFSRFGRNYIETGNYLQKIFPFLGVRFISVTDRFDSLYGDGDDLGVNLKNLANEMYAKDIAVKVRTARKAQWERGSYTGGIPPYGYRAEWVDQKRCLFIEEGSSDIVKEIYRLYGEGKNLKEIVEWLYAGKVHRPKDYRSYGHVYWREGETLQAWCRETVRMILVNPVYAGWLVQTRTCGRDYKIKKKHDISSSDWNIKEGAHEGIVSEEIFCAIAERFRKQAIYSNKAGFSKTVPEEEDIFEGVLYCGQCGSRMGRTSHVKEVGSGDRLKLYGYFCRKSSRIDGTACEKKYITGYALEELVKAALRQEFSFSSLRPKDLVEQSNAAAMERKRVLENELDGIQKEAEAGKRRGSELYLKYRNGEIDKRIFQNWQEQEENQKQKRKARQEEVNRRIREVDTITARQNHFLRTMLKFNEKSRLDSEMLHTLVDRIHVYPGKRLEIVFRFRCQDFVQAAGAPESWEGGGVHERAEKNCSLHAPF